jgi:hypothetical protein
VVGGLCVGRAQAPLRVFTHHDMTISPHFTRVSLLFLFGFAGTFVNPALAMATEYCHNFTDDDVTTLSAVKGTDFRDSSGLGNPDPYRGGIYYNVGNDDCIMDTAETFIYSNSSTPIEDSPQIKMQVFEVDSYTDTLDLMVAESDWVTINDIAYTLQTFTFDETVTLKYYKQYVFLIVPEFEVYDSDGGIMIQGLNSASSTNRFKLLTYDRTITGGLDYPPYEIEEPSSLNRGVLFLSQGSASSNSFVQLYSPCWANSDTQPYNECTQDWSATTTVDAMIKIADGDTPIKVEIITEELQGDGTWKVEEYANESYIYETSGTKFLDIDYTLGLGAVSSTTYMTRVCLVPTDGFSLFDNSNCATVKWGNGYTDEEFGEFLRETGIGGYATTTNPDNSVSNWELNNCDDIGITDFKQGTICAFSYLFLPSQESINKFKALQLDNKFPFAYVYDIHTVKEELFEGVQTGSGTIAVDLDFGSGTSTFVFVSVDKLQAVPLADTMRTIMGYCIWFMFAMYAYRTVLRIHDTNTQVV